MIQPIIIAGGSGTRLWPMSRKLYPKQYLALAGEMSMLQETLKRLEGLEDPICSRPVKRPWKMVLRTCTLSGWTRKPF
jgi:mannose-1-phosphate guanylyltransferase